MENPLHSNITTRPVEIVQVDSFEFPEGQNLSIELRMLKKEFYPTFLNGIGNPSYEWVLSDERLEEII